MPINQQSRIRTILYRVVSNGTIINSLSVIGNDGLNYSISGVGTANAVISITGLPNSSWGYIPGNNIIISGTGTGGVIYTTNPTSLDMSYAALKAGETITSCSFFY